MGIAALTLGIVGLFAWILPPLGLAISVIGLILGILEMIISKKQKRRAVTGMILCILSIALSIGALVGLFTAGMILEEWLRQYSTY